MDTSDYIVFFIGAAFIVFSFFQIFRRYFFLEKRCTAQIGGNILDIERNVTDHTDDTPTTVSYHVKYHYLVGGVNYQKRRSISKRAYKSLNKNPGSNFDITVFYDPSKPKRHYVLEIKFRIIFKLILIALVATLLYGYYYFTSG